ncbi:MAG TPA: hypothetical protein VF488_09775 [Gemmatimonadaceae bacterium]
MAVVIATLSGAVVAVADPAAGGDLNADTRALVAQLTAERAITLAKERRLADAAQEELSRRLAAQDLARRAAEAKAAGNAAALLQARKARDEIARQREELVAALEQRDRTLAAEVRAYREEVTKLAASPDPEKQKALQLFADGERTKALAVLDAIADARRAAHEKAVQNAVRIADAAERRPTAWLAMQAHDVGEVTLDQLVGRFEQLMQLDPTMTTDWIELARLYRVRGRLADARRAAEAAYQSVPRSSERDRSAVLDELGGVVLEAGDLAGAKARFEEGLAILRKLAHDNPMSAQALSDVSLSLERLGDAAVRGGDLVGAKVRLEESLALRRKLAHDNPTSAQALRDVIVSLIKLGKTTRDLKLLREALDLTQGLARSGHLAPSDSGMVDAITRLIDAIP